MTDFDTLRQQIIHHDVDPFEKGNGSVDFTETYKIGNVPGMMRLTVQSPRNFWFVDKLDGNKLTHLKNFLQRKRCADGVIWEQREADQWILHVVELKRSVNVSVWEHIKSQFAVAYRLCRMVAASLDIEFEQVLFYTALVNDNVSSNSDDTADIDPIIETPELDMPDDMPLPWDEWKSGRCRIGDNGWSNNYTDREYIHNKICLTETINGTYVSTGNIGL